MTTSETSGIIAVAVASVGFFVLLAAAQPPAPVAVETHEVEFTITGLRPPKHFAADLMDRYGAVNRNVAVSKHCNRWREIQIGSKITLPVTVYRDHEGKTFTRINAYKVCPGN